MAEHYIIDDKEHVYEAAYEKHHTKKTVTLNGTYNAEDEPGDITGYSEVTVNVEGGGSATLITKNITENGTYNASSDQADGYSSVSVEVPSVQPTQLKAVHIVTHSTGDFDASIDIIHGHMDNNTFVQETTENVPYGSVSNTPLYFNIAFINYSGGKWHVTATLDCSDGTNKYTAGSEIKSWNYYDTVDFYVYSDMYYPTGPVLVEKTITANGVYDPSDDNADGYSGVTVNVPVPSTLEITSDLEEYIMVIDAAIESSVSLNGLTTDVEAEEVV